MKFLVLIPARGGSKGVPGKNIKSLKGKPLIQYTIDAAREIFAAEDICVSTDDIKIRDVVEANGLPVAFLRPYELATDTAGSHEVILHAIEYYEELGRFYDAVVLLQPTSPFRTTESIRGAISLFKEKIDMIVSVNESKANPYYNLFEEDESGFLSKSKVGKFERRQDVPKVWEYNGAIYVINISSLKKRRLHELTAVRKYVMSESESLDIDTPLDWKVAEYIMGIQENR